MRVGPESLQDDLLSQPLQTFAATAEQELLQRVSVELVRFELNRPNELVRVGPGLGTKGAVLHWTAGF